MLYKLNQLLLVAASLYVLRLAVTDKLILYIHPRYVIFTIVMAVIALVLSVISFGSTKSKLPIRNALIYIPFALIVISGLIFVPKSLSSYSVSQRSVDNSLTSSGRAEDTLSYYGGSSKNLSLVDWSRLLVRNTNPDYYTNKEVDVIGFLYDDGSDDSFQIARFVVTCCTVDAQPTGLQVSKPNWASNYEQDEWLRIVGTIKEVGAGQDKKLMLVPDSIEKVEEPDNPYVN